MTEPTFFRTASTFRKWLEENHDRTPELLIGFHRVDSGKGGITYREALDEALCFGWIDGVRKRFDADSYTIRFTPRKPSSIWSVVNTTRIDKLINMGRVHPAGLKVFQQRDEKRSKLYSYEVGNCKFAPEHEEQFRADPTAWEFYQAQAPWYRRVSCYWVMSAKREETRLRRLATLIDDSANARRIKQLTANPKKPE
ncbi:MAG TPA: YdeI/OmpD-associated family protein [Terriglobales bacterium]